jgi:type I restriction enzyme S subunit
VFFTRTSETAAEIGTTSVLLDDAPETVFSGFVLRARPKNYRLDNAFKKYCFSTGEVRNQIVSMTVETTRALTNGRVLSSVWIACPPLKEQREIALVLSDFDSEIAVLEQQREKIEAIKQGMRHALLTGRVRLSE